MTPHILARQRKAIYHMLFLAALIFMFNATLHAQTFTKITTGALVTDGGASRAVVWADYDKDNDLDLFVSNGPRAGQRAFLYRNDGAPNYTFTKITDSPLVGDNARSDGSSWGDYDNDGDVDAYVATWYGDRNLFYDNAGAGVFTKIVSGVIVGDNDFSETCSWGDYDNDGFLDLYVANSGDVNSTGPQRNILYHNNGNKTFTKIATGAIVTDAFYSRGVNWVDYDEDGDFDMFVANEENQNNNLYRNLLKESGAASFEKVTTGPLVTDGGISWSASWGDYDNDGDLDVFVANWNQNDFLYRNEGGGTFLKITSGVLVSDGGHSACSGWGDYDNDGDLDLFVTNAYASVQVRNSLYRNQLMESGSPTFEKVTAGELVNDLGWSYGFSWGDYDRDGDLDVFIARTFNEAQNNAFFRNEATGKHWLEVNCAGVVSNRSAIGAKLFVKAVINGKGVWQRRDLEGQSGYCGQNLQAHFGLGDATAIDSLKIAWPSGKVTVLQNLAVDTSLTITEDSTTTSIQEGANEHAPGDFELAQNFPNPLSVRGALSSASATTIRFALPKPETVSLVVYDVLGREVAVLLNQSRAAGKHQILFQMPPEAGAGVYFYRMSAGKFTATKKLVVVKS